MREIVTNALPHTQPVAPRPSRRQPPRMLTGRQIAAARVLLGWNMAELARHARLSAATIQRAEAAGDQVPSMKTSNLFAIQRALEAAGVRFLENGREGVYLETPK